MRIVSLASVAVLATVLVGCQGVQQHAASVREAQQSGDRMTVGKVQREIRVGMANAEVVEVLGSPNMVTTDDKRRETWVYDKIATETAYSTDSGGVSALILGGGLVGPALGGVIGNGRYNSTSGAASTSQRTLTVIIKFDEGNRVRDFSYRSSSF